MNCPDIPPCDVQHLTPIATVYIACAFGVLGLAAFVLVLKGVELWLRVRALRIHELHRREP